MSLATGAQHESRRRNFTQFNLGGTGLMKTKIFADMLRKKLNDRSAGPAQRRILGMLSDEHLVELYNENHRLSVSK